MSNVAASINRLFDDDGELATTRLNVENTVLLICPKIIFCPRRDARRDSHLLLCPF